MLLVSTEMYVRARQSTGDGLMERTFVLPPLRILNFPANNNVHSFHRRLLADNQCHWT